MEESPYVFFLGFAFLWILLGLVSVYFVFKSQGPLVKIPAEAWIVAIPILAAFAISIALRFVPFSFNL